MLEPVCLALDDLLDIMHGKDLERQREIVRIQKELRHVLKLEHIWAHPLLVP